ncbi:hypothetical protein PN456_01015, partial [Nodularia spumigena CS-586/05]|uniref:hypothetical protein n=1 Tax=Nodularia spumigena TaxID=70799 RepID=UPI0023311C64
CCGDDSLGVALRKNSSMPGLYFTENSLALIIARGFLFFLFVYLFNLATTRFVNTQSLTRERFEK